MDQALVTYCTILMLTIYCYPLQGNCRPFDDPCKGSVPENVLPQSFVKNNKQIAPNTATNDDIEYAIIANQDSQIMNLDEFSSNAATINNNNELTMVQSDHKLKDSELSLMEFNNEQDRAPRKSQLLDGITGREGGEDTRRNVNRENIYEMAASGKKRNCLDHFSGNKLKEIESMNKQTDAVDLSKKNVERINRNFFGQRESSIFDIFMKANKNSVINTARLVVDKKNHNRLINSTINEFELFQVNIE